MNNLNYDYLILGIVLSFSVLLNFTNRISMKNLKFKRLHLFVNRGITISKNAILYIVRGVIFFLVTLVQIILLKCYMSFSPNIFLTFNCDEIIKKILVCLLGVIVSLKFFFVISILIFIILKKDLKNYIKTLSWIQCRKEYPLYTKIIRPMCIAFIDTIIYVALMPYILSRALNINFILSIIIVSIVYGVGKSMLSIEKEHKILMFVFFFTAVFSLNLVYGYTENLFCPLVGFVILIWFWTFKK